MKRLTWSLLIALLLAACAIPPPGEDDKGKEMKQQAAPVLTALASYRKDRGDYPKSLYELVPKYLTEIPFGPNFNYLYDKKLIQFSYSASWPQVDTVGCVATLGQTEWTCKSFQ